MTKRVFPVGIPDLLTMLKMLDEVGYIILGDEEGSLTVYYRGSAVRILEYKIGLGYQETDVSA